MPGNILTPATIWANFNVNITPKATIVSEKKCDDVVFTYLKLEGQTVGDNKVQIACVMAQARQQKIAPAILVAQEFGNQINERLLTTIVNKGYTVLAVDLTGKVDGEDFYTEYPEEISYANYEVAKADLFNIESDVTKTCWYQWVCATRYCLKYLKDMPNVTKIGAIGIGNAATVIWQVAATDSNLSGAAFIRNAGWSVYKGTHKFSDQDVPHFSDKLMKVLAGIEPQAYAPHVKIPTFTIVSANDNHFDVDRAFDTISRINDGVYNALNYSVSGQGKILINELQSVEVFFDKCLKQEKENLNLPDEVELKCDVADGVCKLRATANQKDLVDITLYVAEGQIDPALRSWVACTKNSKSSSGEYRFTYKPYNQSEFVTFFAKATYKNGLQICSPIIAKKLDDQIVGTNYKSAILYSSREQGSESKFLAYPPSNQTLCAVDGLNFDTSNGVRKQAGPMEIEGVCCDSGLLTFCVGSPKYHPNDGALLMFDVTAVNNATIEVVLFVDYYGEKIAYTAPVTIKGGQVWHNVKLETMNFKAPNGMGLKSYDRVQALALISDEGFIINNLLWI